MSSRRTLLSNTPRGRPGSAAPSRPQQQHQERETQLPAYEPPSCPLDAQARRALSELSTNAAETRKYGEQLARSLKLLGESVAEVNDRHADRRGRLQARRERERGQGSGQDGENHADRTEADRALEAAVDDLGRRVPALTKRSEEAVRDVIDWGVELQDGRQALADAAAQTTEESKRAEEVAQSNEARRQQAAARREALDDGDGPDEDDEDEDEPVEVAGPRRLLRQNRDRLAADYQAKTMHQRYGLNNDYIQFKRLWHDAVHGQDGKPLPDASRWFGGADGEEDADEDEDEDLIVAGEKKDLKCPLSLVMMTEPYTSARCNHTFEKTAIMEFLSNKPGRRAQCPQTGCSQEVSVKDFTLDQYMLRKIKRAQEDEDQDNDDDDDDDAMNRTDIIRRSTRSGGIGKGPEEPFRMCVAEVQHYRLEGNGSTLVEQITPVQTVRNSWDPPLHVQP
ncbi:hypothetical protein JX266_004262 [Neoarthrinium moseri]|nr:hypothetical protein JX266_004262 [Neoarthrinium moseri]